MLSYGMPMTTRRLSIINKDFTTLQLHWEIGWRKNQMSINISKTKTMNIKGNITATFHGNPVQLTESQKHLGIVVKNCLTWTDYSKKRCSKMNALYQLRWKMSEKHAGRQSSKRTPAVWCPLSHTHLKPGCWTEQIWNNLKTSIEKQQSGSCQRM